MYDILSPIPRTNSVLIHSDELKLNRNSPVYEAEGYKKGLSYI